MNSPPERIKGREAQMINNGYAEPLPKPKPEKELTYKERLWAEQMECNGLRQINFQLKAKVQALEAVVEKLRSSEQSLAFLIRCVRDMLELEHSHGKILDMIRNLTEANQGLSTDKPTPITEGV